MKKLQLFIILLVVLGLLAYADYAVNVPEGIDLPNIPQIKGQKDSEPEQPAVVNLPNVTQSVLDSSGLSQTYTIEKRNRTAALFETFDLRGVANVSDFTNVLTSSQERIFPIYIDEIHGPAGQGRVTYLNIKLQLINQLGSSAAINETGSFGFNSLFYNDEKNPETGFLLSQVGDMVFGFKYSKNSTTSFDSIQKFIETYMSQVTN